MYLHMYILMYVYVCICLRIYKKICNTLQLTATQHINLQLCNTATRCLHVSLRLNGLCTYNVSIRNTPHHTATHCNTLQHAATCCNMLQHAATCCNMLLAFGCTVWMGCLFKTCAYCIHCNSTATRCNTLQHTATHRNTL